MASDSQDKIGVGSSVVYLYLVSRHLTSDQGHKSARLLKIKSGNNQSPGKPESILQTKAARPA